MVCHHCHELSDDRTYPASGMVVEGSGASPTWVAAIIGDGLGAVGVGCDELGSVCSVIRRVPGWVLSYDRFGFPTVTAVGLLTYYGNWLRLFSTLGTVGCYDRGL